ncbi:MAG: EAL domain-containing protein [Pseudomonadales bacterium]|jgi:diguanylate cyclase (GGDEF)-like protein/PAS domain S-box-containing protein|nr:EAL domain-containing protein [Pseudomonadales bacterium]
MDRDDCAALRALVDGVDAMLVTLDERGRVVHANRACERFFGIPHERLLGRHCTQFVEEGERDRLQADMEELDVRTSACQRERRSRRADGVERVLLWQHQRILENGSTGFRAVALDVTELHDAQARLTDLVYNDPLTGLPNRRLLEDRLRQASARLRRESERFAVHMLDLDRFKQVNDTFGHAVGDRLLVAVADRLRALLRGTDTLARLGGDEFAILQPRIRSEASAEILARKVTEMLAVPFELDGHEVRIGVSVGIALAEDPSLGAERLLESADRALYAVKDSGRGFYAFDTSVLGEKALEEFELARALERALESGGLYLVWQPEYHLRRDHISAVEALVRWRRSSGEVLGPGSIVRLAERHGLMHRVGDWIIEHALRQFGAWRASGVDVPRLCVNLSAHQLRDPLLADRIRQALARHDVPAHAVQFELTESGFIADEQTMVTSLERLANLGVSVAIDDFGTGYSSFAYLRSFAFARLKVAQEFAERSRSNDDERAILRAAVSLANGLGIEAVVEGVESSATLEELRALGVESIQGYIVAEPEDGTGMEQTLRHPERLRARIAARP